MLTTTSTELLVGLRDPRDDAVWTEFCSRYRPLILSFARRLGLTESDAQDVAQETLLAFATAYRQGKYDRDRGRLRSWLFGITFRKTRDTQRRRGRELMMGNEEDTAGLLAQVADEQRLSEIWEAEWRQAVIRTCIEEVRAQVGPRTMRAFELITLEARPTKEVAALLDMTCNAVIQANLRVLSRMRARRESLEVDW